VSGILEKAEPINQTNPRSPDYQKVRLDRQANFLLSMVLIAQRMNQMGELKKDPMEKLPLWSFIACN